MRRSIEYPTAMINGPARLKVMADRPTHTCIPGNRRLSVPADKTGSRAPYTPHRGPTYIRTYVRDATTHGVYTAWRGAAWRCRGMRGAHAYACSQHLLLQDGRSRHYVATLRSTYAAPEEHVCPPCSPSFVVHHPRVDFRFRVHIFFSFHFIFVIFVS